MQPMLLAIPLALCVTGSIASELQYCSTEAKWGVRHSLTRISLLWPVLEQIKVDRSYFQCETQSASLI